jgi:4-hydroxythreonine-4-phosphate dehydrogenase
MTARRPLVITMGEPAGVGLELTCRAWLSRSELDLAPFALFADPTAVEARARACGLEIAVATIEDPAAATVAFASALPVVPVHLAAPSVPGHPAPANAAAVIEAIERAVAAVEAGRARAVVTNPIAKSVLIAAGFGHPGHTEFLAALAERRRPGRRLHPVMMLASDDLRVVPLTIHIPVRDVADAIDFELVVVTARIMNATLKADFGIAKPRIAVAGLNPHAGEAGKIGREEITVIAPAVAQLQAEGVEIRGPLSADTLFHAAARRTYDAVLAMYHDQALIPIKTLAFDAAVNVTLGLPFVRTSPDHGTAFDIAGRGIASPTSLIAALRMADAMADRRAGQQG